MSFFVDLKTNKEKLEKQFKAKYKNKEMFDAQSYVNAFSFPKTPVILDSHPEDIILGNWGLIPSWSKDTDIRKYTLNAKIETLSDKPSFKNSLNKRCLVLVNGFYEYQWLDAKGKEKKKYRITVENQELFALGAIYSEWTDSETGEIINTYSIVTTSANKLMAKIHNTKKRMPVVLSHDAETKWLSNKNVLDFSFPNYEADLIAIS